MGIIEVAPNDWRLTMVLDHAVEVVCNESFPTREEAVETIVDRLEECADPDQLRSERIQKFEFAAKAQKECANWR